MTDWRGDLLKIGIIPDDMPDQTNFVLFNLDELANHMIKELDRAREEGRRDGALAFYIELEDWLYEKGYAKDGEIKVPTEVFMRFVAKELKLNSKKK